MLPTLSPARLLWPHSSRGVAQDGGPRFSAHTRPEAFGASVRRAGATGKKKKPRTPLRQTGGHADDLSPRPPFCISSVGLIRP